MRPNNFLNKKNRCPYCAEVYLNGKKFSTTHSKAEDIIDKYLSNHNFKYEREVKFPETGRLRFDFKVIFNDNIFWLIEFDGRFHRKPSPKASQKAFEKWEHQIKNDEHKNTFCKNKNIKLIRISSFKNIEKILDKEFNDYSNGDEISQ
jgi:hypothetical protein